MRTSRAEPPGRGAAPWLGLLAAATAGIALLASAAHLHPGRVDPVGATPSPFLPLLPEGTGPPAPLAAAARALGLDALGPGWATALAVALVAAAGAGFVGALLAARRGNLSARAVLWWTGTLLAVVAVLPPLLSRDVSSYAIYGRIWAVHGANPYLAVPAGFPGDPFRPAISPEWVRTPSVYGPAFTLASGGIVRAFGSVAATLAAFKVLAVTAAFLTTVLAAGLGAARGPERAAFAAAAVGLNPAVLFHAAGGSHNDVLVGLSVAGALALWGSGRRLAATAVLALGALVKPVAGIPLVLAVAAAVAAAPAGRERLRIAALHAGTALGLAGLALLPFGSGEGTLRAFAGLASRQGWASPARLSATAAEGLGRAVGGEGLADALSAIVRGAFLAVFAVAFVALLRRSGRMGAGPSWGWALLLFSLCAAYLLPWYVAWFAPLLGLMGDRRATWVGVALSVGLALTAIPAEPGVDPGIWSGAIDAVHWVGGPLALGLLVAALAAFRHSLREVDHEAVERAEGLPG